MIDIYCSHCGSRNVTRDATVAWDRSAQEWTVRAVFDNADCDDCGGETRLRQVNLTTGHAVDCAVIP